MSIKRVRPEIEKSKLENEVILAVVILYVVLSTVLLMIHHMQPEGAETQTSSTSPSHGDFATAARTASPLPGVDASSLELEGVRDLLIREGFQDVGDLRAVETGFQATARRRGLTWDVTVDATSGRISRVPKAIP